MESAKVRYIADGATLAAAYAGYIAVSQDGTNWNYINGIGCSVGKHGININTTAPNSHPERGASAKTYMVVVTNGEGSSVLKFDPNKVLNQAGWLGGTIAKAQQAVDDIASWI